MLKHILATTALATLLATGVHAQTAPAPVAPAQEGTQSGEMPGEGVVTPMDEGATTPPEVVQDEPMAPSDTTPPEVVQDEPLAPAPGAMETETDMAEPADPAAEGDWGPIDLATMSTDDLIGTSIVTYENETIASIEDVLITDDGQVESVVARFGGFLGFGSDRVLLTIDELEVMQDADESVIVRTNLTPEGIEGRPTYEG